MGDPFRTDTQGNESEAWDLYFSLKRLQMQLNLGKHR